MCFQKGGGFLEFERELRRFFEFKVKYKNWCVFFKEKVFIKQKFTVYESQYNIVFKELKEFYK